MSNTVIRRFYKYGSNTEVFAVDDLVTPRGGHLKKFRVEARQNEDLTKKVDDTLHLLLSNLVDYVDGKHVLDDEDEDEDEDEDDEEEEDEDYEDEEDGEDDGDGEEAEEDHEETAAAPIPPNA